MKWKYAALIIVAVGLLLSLYEPVLAQTARGMMDGQRMGGRGQAFDMIEKGRDMRMGQGMYGLGFIHSTGNAYGEYVTFTVDESTGSVFNYGVAGNPLFNISIANFNYKSTNIFGSITRVSNTDGSTIIQLHDNPAAVINILTNRSISIIFTLADGVNATKEDNLVRVESGDVVGYIIGTDTAVSSVSDSQVKVEASPNSAVVFRASPVNMPMFGRMHLRFSQEVARNRVGMEIALGRNGTYNAINYSAGMQMSIQSMERNHIRLLINATEPAGRIIAINLDNSSLAIGPRERIRIRYDGMPLQCVNDPDMVFNETDRPLCWVSSIQDSVRAQLLIHIPKFSERTIDIVVEPEIAETPASTSTANVTVTTPLPIETPKAPGFELIVSLAGLFTWVTAKRRSKR